MYLHERPNSDGSHVVQSLIEFLLRGRLEQRSQLFPQARCIDDAAAHRIRHGADLKSKIFSIWPMLPEIIRSASSRNQSLGH